MGTIKGTLTTELAWNKKKKQEFHACTKNIRTINEIHNLRNNKKDCQEIETKLKDLGKGFRI